MGAILSWLTSSSTSRHKELIVKAGLERKSVFAAFTASARKKLKSPDPYSVFTCDR